MTRDSVKSLDGLMNSLSHAEEVVKRLESQSQNMEEHSLIHETLHSHNLFMKIIAVVGSIFTIGTVMGGILVTYQAKDDDKRLAVMEIKLDILQNRTEFMEQTNKMMVDSLLKIQQKEIEKK